MAWFRRRDKHSEAGDENPTQPDPDNAVVPQPADWSSSGLVSVTSEGGVRVDVSSVAEARIAIKDLRLRKRQLSADRKAVNQRISELRAQRRLEVARHGSLPRGGGNFGKTLRAIDRMGRDAERSRFAESLVPYEDQKRGIEKEVAGLDYLINQLDAYILRSTGPDSDSSINKQ